MPCIYLAVGGVAKNFLPLLLKELKIKKKMEALEILVTNYMITTNKKGTALP
jgi:hypothetical protein